MPARHARRLLVVLILLGTVLVGVMPAAARPTQQGGAVLPAPLYFIGSDNQIQRLETDGITRTTLTTDLSPQFAEFDVSPFDGSLAYISAANSLIVTDALGGNARVIFDGGAIVLDSDGFATMDAQRSNVLATPRWSPDGTRIAVSFGGGLYLVPASGGEAQLLLAAGQPVAEAPPEFPAGAKFYHPNAWSPDGIHLSITVLFVPEGSGVVVIDTSNPATVTGEYLLCCGTATWNLDGTGIYASSAAFVFGISGLWQIDPTNPTPAALIPGSVAEAPSFANMVVGAQQLTDGNLYFFFGTFNFDAPENSGALGMVRAASDGSAMITVRSETYLLIGDVLWAADASGAVVSTDQLLWLKTDDSAPVILAESGRVLRWGKP